MGKVEETDFLLMSPSQKTHQHITNILFLCFSVTKRTSIDLAYGRTGFEMHKNSRINKHQARFPVNEAVEQDRSLVLSHKRAEALRGARRAQS